MKITVLTTTEEFQKTLLDYKNAILMSKNSQTKENRAAENKLQQIAEESLRKLLTPKGLLKTTSGKYGQASTTDYTIDYDKITKSQIDALKQTLIGKYGLEAKLSSQIGSGVKIGQLTIRNNEQHIVGPTTGLLTGAQIFNEMNLEGDSLVNSIDSNNLTNYLFNTLFVNFPDLKTIFYSKASSMIINTFDTNNKAITYALEIPISNFTDTNYKAKKDGNAIVLYLNDSFQKSLIDNINKAAISIANNIPITSVTLHNNQKADIFFRPAKDFLTYAIDISGSIATVPGGGVKIRLKSTGKAKEKSKEESVKSISNIQLTALVQQETEKRMPHGPLRGPPLSPTVLTYRSGQFVDSIKVIQNFRQNIIKYYYAPNYRVHEKKGARAPRFLLQSSIRETVKQVYGQQFRIIRGF